MTVLLALAGCLVLQEVEPDDPCLEAGVAIAFVTEACTGDVELANARYEAYTREITCRPVRAVDLDTADPALADLYGCALAIRLLPCEAAADFGDDLLAWMAVSPACTWVAELPEAG